MKQGGAPAAPPVTTVVVREEIMLSDVDGRLVNGIMRVCNVAVLLPERVLVYLFYLSV